MGHNHDVLAEMRGPVKDLRSQIPDTWAGFAAMYQGAFAEGAIPARLKEVIALAMSVAAGCEGCIAAHARGAARKGATPEEVAEGLGVALQMTGGPGSVHGPRAWSAYLEFKGD